MYEQNDAPLPLPTVLCKAQQLTHSHLPYARKPNNGNSGEDYVGFSLTRFTGNDVYVRFAVPGGLGDDQFTVDSRKAMHTVFTGALVLSAR